MLYVRTSIVGEQMTCDPIEEIALAKQYHL